ncbi:MAG: hypothetical protein AAGC64_00715 [Bacteroidota bacterium]
MKRYLYSHWFWFFVLFCFYNFYDFVEHINRAGSLFEQHPIDWFLFSFVSATTIGFIIYFTTNTLRILKIPALISDLLAFSLAFCLYLNIIGPLWNNFFWPYDDLKLQMKVLTIGILLCIYIFYRILFIIIISLIKKVLPL